MEETSWWVSDRDAVVYLGLLKRRVVSKLKAWGTVFQVYHNCSPSLVRVAGMCYALSQEVDRRRRGPLPCRVLLTGGKTCFEGNNVDPDVVKPITHRFRSTDRTSVETDTGRYGR